jgi:uncharacterized integral membrane protein
MLQNIRSILLGLWILTLLVFLVQNWGSAAAVVVAGQAGAAIPLSLTLLTAYGVGVGLGFLYVGAWRLHDRVFQRQAIRKLNQLIERVRFLEAQMIPPRPLFASGSAGSPGRPLFLLQYPAGTHSRPGS